jgi:glucosamine--fructose-6-phosphate aminotransferase (isomerizing)
MKGKMSTTLLESEILEQPGAIQRIISEETAGVIENVATLRNRFDSILIAARGTSDNAARYAQYLFGAHNQLPVALATPSLFTLYNRPPVLKRMLVIGISQSGQSPDIVAVLSEARRQGQPTLAITNDPLSPLAQAAETIIPLRTGPERAVAATKTYTASLAALALFSAALAGDQDRLAEMQRLPALMQETLESLPAALVRVERYRYINRCAVIGRGYNYATAFEVALKVKELTGVVAESYSSADFRHGPIAIVKDGFPVLVIACSGDVAGDLTALISELKQRDSELLLISDQPDLLAQAKLPLWIPAGVPEWLTPLLAVLPGQYLGLTLCQTKGLNPDHPQGLTKVTETY